MEWIGSMMAICLVQIENDQYFKMILDWVFKVIDVWATCIVETTFVMSLFSLVLPMKSHGVGTQFDFPL
jgi:hypothetical protein